VFIFASFTTYAQLQTSEECIHDTLKSGSVPKELAAMVRYNCVSEGVDELDVGKLSTVLTAKYGSINA
jgi:type I restriction enzyme R subunit